MKILAAVDGSEVAFNALRSACILARKTAAAVTALYVNKGNEYTPDETGTLALQERIREELEARGQEALRRSIAIGREYGIAIQGVMSDGIPADEILQYAEAHGIIRLIAMAHSSQGRGSQEFAESPTRAVVSRSRIPVLVTSRATEISRILIAVDHSELTKQVARYGGSLARSLGAEVGILAFVPDTEALIDEYRLIADVPNIDRHIEASEKDLKRILDQAVAMAREALGPLSVEASTVVKKGNGQELLSEVAERDALVIGLKRNADAPANLGGTVGRILSAPTVNAFFVQ